MILVLHFNKHWVSSPHRILQWLKVITGVNLGDWILTTLDLYVNVLWELFLVIVLEQIGLCDIQIFHSDLHVSYVLWPLLSSLLCSTTSNYFFTVLISLYFQKFFIECLWQDFKWQLCFSFVCFLKFSWHHLANIWTIYAIVFGCSLVIFGVFCWTLRFSNFGSSSFSTFLCAVF